MWENKTFHSHYIYCMRVCLYYACVTCTIECMHTYFKKKILFLILQKYFFRSVIELRYTCVRNLNEIKMYICVAMVNFPFCLETTPG